ncbi:hypothetical protein CROQUDRAFT_326956 [Cronartium quercuum f. sp. fusiforme G11]|uniref:Uncharacterized protein n=1 Tax=Cronartium quercuum f. sp. fusiforme G11 TaxID=708437 RepID=A0A9P6NBB5_9BASI|nr:hypothetical protein CROQUDRAFT_326956 [Cronartium quercuum f. sp. fusiforme G11]
MNWSHLQLQWFKLSHLPILSNTTDQSDLPESYKHIISKMQKNSMLSTTSMIPPIYSMRQLILITLPLLPSNLPGTFALTKMLKKHEEVQKEWASLQHQLITIYFIFQHQTIKLDHSGFVSCQWTSLHMHHNSLHRAFG